MRLPFPRRRKKQLEDFSPLDLSQQNAQQRVKLKTSAKANAERLQELVGKNADFHLRELVIPTSPQVVAQICFIETLTDSNLFDRQILRPLLEREKQLTLKELPGDTLSKKIGSNLIHSAKVRELKYEDEVLSNIFYGGVIIFLEGSEIALAVGLKRVPERGITEPQDEAARRGPHQGFTECLSSNMALVRMRLKTGKLRFESFRVGRLSKTDGAVVYIEGIANPALVEEARRRIRSLDVDMVEDNSILEMLIQDHPKMVFPTTFYTERPDLAASSLAEGRIAILLENSPTCLIVPANFYDFFKTAEDNYLRWPFTAFLRVARILAGLIALWAPAIYIAITTFHHEMLPTPLALSIAAARENVPFPAFLEVFSMELVLELVFEAGVRLPSPVGQTIGIVGAVVLGQAAVSAQLVSPILVIVVAISAIASFMVPLYVREQGVRLLRFPGMILGATMGLYGIMAGMAAIVAVQCAITSFGQPYMTPLAPLWPGTLQDLLFRSSHWQADARPGWLRTVDRRRQAEIVRDWEKDGANPDGEVDLSGE